LFFGFGDMGILSPFLLQLHSKKNDMGLNTKVTLVFGNEAGGVKKVETTLKGLLDAYEDEFLEQLEEPCTSASCNTESQNFCDCGGEYEDYVLKDILLNQGKRSID